MATPTAVHAWMRRQHGLITRAQALQATMTVGQIRGVIEGGEWLRVRTAVYAAAGVRATFEQTVLAAVLAAGPGAVAAGATACRLWGVDGPPTTAIELLTTPVRRMRLDGVIAHRSVVLDDSDRTVTRGVPVTTAERTVVDCSTRLTPLQLGVLTDALRRRDVLRYDALAATLNRLGAARGRSTASVHDVLAIRLEGYDPGESELEARVLRLIRRAGLPAPVQQFPITIGSKSYRLDLAWPELRVAVELDGFRDHGLLRSRFDADRSRANRITLDGWLMLHFTTAHSDAEIVATISDGLPGDLPSHARMGA